MVQPSPYYPLPSTPPRRSAIPRVIGILAIVFACIGVLGSLTFTLGPLSDLRRHRDELGFVITWIYLWMAISFVIFGLHVVGGILAVTYRKIGLRLLTAYGVAAVLLVVLDMLILWGFAPHGFRVESSLTWPRTGWAMLAVPWPVVVLVLVNLRRSQAACH